MIAKMKKIRSVIIVLIVIGAFIGGFYYNAKLSKNNTNQNETANVETEKNVQGKNETANTVTNETTNKTTNEAKQEEKVEDIYSEVIKSYKLAKEEYDPNQVSTINTKYSLVNETLISHVYVYSENNVGIGYTFYDIDNNGKKELIVGVTNGSDNSMMPVAIYTYTKNKEVKKIYFLETIERGNLAIYNNGVIYSNGSGGAAIHYYDFFKMSSDGSSLETLEKVREEYKTSTDVKYYNNENDKELNYKNINEIETKYINGSKEIKFNADNTIK